MKFHSEHKPRLPLSILQDLHVPGRGLGMRETLLKLADLQVLTLTENPVSPVGNPGKKPANDTALLAVLWDFRSPEGGTLSN